jgi:RND family efflux transporter MFP subunit
MLNPHDSAPAARAKQRARPQPQRPPPGTGHRIQILVAGIAIALVVAFFIVYHARQQATADLAQDTKEQAALLPAVIVSEAEKAPVATSLTLPGNTAAWYESTIFARVSGYVAQWFVDIGDHVKKDQVLATIDTPDLDAEVSGAQAKLESGKADVKVRQAEAAFAKTTYERWRNSPTGVVSEQERDAKKADFGSTTAQLNAALANVDADQGNVDRLTALTQFKKVTAPYDGTIIERRIDIGNLVTAGSTTNTTLLYRMSQDDPMRVYVDAPQSVAADMTVGLPATMTVNDLTHKTFTGRIARTSNAIDPRARTLRVEVDVPNPNDLLVPGLYVQVTFELKARGNVVVPASAMNFRSSGPQVAVVGADDRVTFHDVVIARDDGNVLELSSGVAPGDRIVLNTSSAIANGTKVTVTEEQTAGAATADR